MKLTDKEEIIPPTKHQTEGFVEKAPMDSLRKQDLSPEMQVQDNADLVSERAEFAANHPIMARILFPKEASVVVKGQAEAMHNQIEARNDASRMLQRSMLSSWETKLNAAVAQYGLHIDAGLQNAVNEIRVQRQKDIQKSVDEFVGQIQVSISSAEKIEVDFVKDLEMTRIKKDVEQFYKVQDEFNEKFLEKIKFRAGDVD